MNAAKSQRISELLSQPVDFSKMSSRQVGGGKAAAYLPNEAVIEKANDIFGFEGWACDIKKLEVDYAVQNQAGKWSIGVQCLMRVSVVSDGREICWHTDIGYGGSTNMPSFEQAAEFARKNAVTDARKRCLKLFGTALGSDISSAETQKIAREHKQGKMSGAAAAGGAKPAPFQSTSSATAPPGPVRPTASLPAQQQQQSSSSSSSSSPALALSTGMGPGQQFHPSSSSPVPLGTSTSMPQQHQPSVNISHQSLACMPQQHLSLTNVPQQQQSSVSTSMPSQHLSTASLNVPHQHQSSGLSTTSLLLVQQQQQPRSSAAAAMHAGCDGAVGMSDETAAATAVHAVDGSAITANGLGMSAYSPPQQHTSSTLPPQLAQQQQPQQHLPHNPYLQQALANRAAIGASGATVNINISNGSIRSGLPISTSATSSTVTRFKASDLLSVGASANLVLSPQQLQQQLIGLGNNGAAVLPSAASVAPAAAAAAAAVPAFSRFASDDDDDFMAAAEALTAPSKSSATTASLGGALGVASSAAATLGGASSAAMLSPAVAVLPTPTSARSVASHHSGAGAAVDGGGNGSQPRHHTLLPPFAGHLQLQQQQQPSFSGGDDVMGGGNGQLQLQHDAMSGSVLEDISGRSGVANVAVAHEGRPLLQAGAPHAGDKRASVEEKKLAALAKKRARESSSASSSSSSSSMSAGAPPSSSFVHGSASVAGAYGASTVAVPHVLQPGGADAEVTGQHAGFSLLQKGSAAAAAAPGMIDGGFCYDNPSDEAAVRQQHGDSGGFVG